MVVTKKIVVSFALFVGTSCYATVPSNAVAQHYENIKKYATLQQHPNDTTALMRTVTTMFHWLNSLANPNNPVTRHAVKKYFTANAVVYKNGKVVASGRETIYHGIKLFQKHVKEHKIKRARVILPFEQMIVRNNKVTLRYTVVKQKYGHKPKRIRTMTILHMKDGKVQQWRQIHGHHHTH